MTYWQERIKINVNSDLLHFFETFGDNRVRVIKINFRNEQLVLEEYKETEGSWEEDYENFTSLMLVRKQPCFLLFRLDDSNESEYKWILISWIPEDSTVKQKGMFVLTEATLKEAFGRKQIKGRLLVTTANEAHIDNVKRILSYEQPLPPLLSAAKELMMAKALEVYNGVSQNAQLTEINGLIFPISTDAIEAVKELKDKIVNYVQLIEIDDPAELTTNFLVEKIHPKTLITKLKFSKPKPPHHCGPRKLIKRT